MASVLLDWASRLGSVLWGFNMALHLAGAGFYKQVMAVRISLHFILAALCALVFIPVTASGIGPSGSLAPVSVSLFVGAFMFGIGMQLANGCGSGVLFSFGGGSGRMIVALPFFVIGSVIGSVILPRFLELGSLDPIEIGGKPSLIWQAGA
jgi:uncharacterized membrane protein YedE/YeeE